MYVIHVTYNIYTCTSYDSHDQGVWNSTLDVQRLFVECLQLFVILLFRVHLYLQSVDFEQLRPLLHVIETFLSETRLVQLFDDPLKTSEVTAIKAELSELRKCNLISRIIKYKV